MNNFLSLADAGPGGAQALVELARSLEREPRPDALAGKVLGLLFLNPSLRTLASFQSGMARLGGSSFVITPDTSWKLEFEPGVPMTWPLRVYPVAALRSRARPKSTTNASS